MKALQNYLWDKLLVKQSYSLHMLKDSMHGNNVRKQISQQNRIFIKEVFKKASTICGTRMRREEVYRYPQKFHEKNQPCNGLGTFLMDYLTDIAELNTDIIYNFKRKFGVKGDFLPKSKLSIIHDKLITYFITQIINQVNFHNYMSVYFKLASRFLL